MQCSRIQRGSVVASIVCKATETWYVPQDYIESENARLEREQQFWAKEIVVKIEYKFCPNLTIIDTPGEDPMVLSAALLMGASLWRHKHL